MESNDSILRDIIPSDDAENTKFWQRKKCLKFCQILFIVIILGLIAIGIVLLGLVLTVSGKSFMRFIIKNSEDTITSKNVTSMFNEYNSTVIISELTTTTAIIGATNRVFPSTTGIRKKLLAKYHSDPTIDELFFD